MKILAVEFSSLQRSVAVLDADARASDPACLSEVVQTGERSTHALSMIEGALQQAGLEREQVEVLAVGLGPGSYTGIRGAIALAQGWHLARPVKLLGISSADALALQASQAGICGKIAVAIDAQRGEFYFAEYEVSTEGWREQRALHLTTVDAVQAAAQKGTCIIGGPETKNFSGHRLMFPRAAAVGQLALRRSDFVEPQLLQPIYLRETNFVKAPPPRTLPA